MAAAIAEEFPQLFVQGVQALLVGDPTDPRTQVGPLARADLRDTLQRQVEESVAGGAVLLTGDTPVNGPGLNFPPMVLANTGPGLAAFDEETFGPVAAIAIASDDAEVVQLSNASPFGLSMSLWTADRARALVLAKQITTGAVFINATTASDARVTFGGTKKSGYGREFAAAGVREFTNIRSCWAVPAHDSSHARS